MPHVELKYNWILISKFCGSGPIMFAPSIILGLKVYCSINYKNTMHTQG